MTRSTTAKRHRMRCYKCRCAGRGSGRFTIKRHPDDYARPVKCPTCGNENVKSVEAEVRKRTQGYKRCRCPGYPFIHAKGSLRFCEAHPLQALGFEPTEEEITQYEAVISTPRSSW